MFEFLFKALLNTTASLCYFSSVFLSAPLTSLILSYAGMSITYCMFALVNCIVLGIVIFLVPETGGMSYHKFREEKRKKEMDMQEEEFARILEF